MIRTRARRFLSKGSIYVPAYPFVQEATAGPIVLLILTAYAAKWIIPLLLFNSYADQCKKTDNYYYSFKYIDKTKYMVYYL